MEKNIKILFLITELIFNVPHSSCAHIFTSLINHPRCVRCGENHRTDTCTKSRDLPAKCAHVIEIIQPIIEDV